MADELEITDPEILALKTIAEAFLSVDREAWPRMAIWTRSWLESARGRDAEKGEG
jgi:hypothetical protein